MNKKKIQDKSLFILSLLERQPLNPQLYELLKIYKKEIDELKQRLDNIDKKDTR